jgi:hypothetical protein
VVKIKTNPPTVQANRVDLSFGGQPENPIKRNIGWVQITPPKGMAIYENGIDCEDVSFSFPANSFLEMARIDDLQG